MNRVTTVKPAALRPPQPAPKSFLSSPLFLRLHLGLTAALLLGFVVFLVLAATGNVRLGQAAAADPTNGEKPGEKGGGAAKGKDADEKAGRYQIEVVEDAAGVLGETGKLGVLGTRLREAWAFRYRGGFAECRLETDFGGKPTSSGTVPEEWARFIGGEEEIRKGSPEALNKEGYIVLLSVAPTLSVDQALEPFHPHLGAMFTTGPAGPLHGLIPYYHEVWRRREYRVFMSAGPPKGKTGPGFNVWSGDLLLIRTQFVNDDTMNDPANATGGKNLEPGKELTLLERQRGLSVVRLKARFLTDAEAMEKAKPQ